MASRLLLIGLFFVASCSLVLASDPSPLQDFCVADPKSRVLVNGVVCKDPNLVKADDFLFRGLHLMGDTSMGVGSNVTAVTVAELPGLNTFGISMARIDFAPQVFVNGEVCKDPKLVRADDFFFSGVHLMEIHQMRLGLT
ncbi:RmlC-like cupin domain-containing protein [Cynara cardunculus var. scolymus]|uniref:RmlC-like cupin domain-containing protein n=1 Tax=Cynara cardunculus var. scolymus TaxID=59895 RepID=A0A103Y441_CYNCS|nr:RmlC-like cupin domain-containing protein [Cynara cardunculus var. scolymus]